jgi:hypothetical protein
MNETALGAGLTRRMLEQGVESVYRTLDTIDENLLTEGSPRLAGLVELANLSSIVGNILASGIVNASRGVFTRAGAHKYQDLRAAGRGAENIEIKMALETNNPKGHLPKEGHYLTCRYVLGDVDGKCTVGERGDVVWIWELRFGHVEMKHFNISNTEGDSGKTAVINREGMERLAIVYLDRIRCPFGARSRYIKGLPAV